MGLDNPLHIAFLLIVLLLVFGAKRLPEIGRSVGAGMREFKDSISGQAPALTQSAQQPPTVGQQPQVVAQPVVVQEPQVAQQPMAAQAPVATQAPVAESPAAPTPQA
jgi:sec-independent protein translocase protein TatA